MEIRSVSQRLDGLAVGEAYRRLRTRRKPRVREDGAARIDDEHPVDLHETDGLLAKVCVKVGRAPDSVPLLAFAAVRIQRARRETFIRK